MLIVTTAGVRTDTTGQDSIAYTLFQYGARVASGEIDDPSFYMAWWQADDEAEIDDPTAWSAANPGLGDILDRDELAGQAQRARAGGMAESEFRIKRLNQWVSSATAWLPAGLWDAHASERRLVDGERVVLGFDGSYSGDSTGIVACALDGHLQVVGSWERPIDNPQWRVPIAEVVEAIRVACRRYEVVEVAMDPFRWARELQDLDGEGLPVVEYATGSPGRMVPACAKFYDALGAGSGISHDGDPRLARHLANAVLKVDAKGPRIVKEHRGSPRKIDLAVCAVIAYDRASWHAGTVGKEPLVVWD
jgi:phage terminase large subunit-like protein